MNLIKSYDENGNKVLSEGVTHAEIESLKLPDLGEPTLQDRLVEALRGLFDNCAMVHKRWGENSNSRAADEAIAKARALLASLEGTTK